MTPAAQLIAKTPTADCESFEVVIAIPTFNRSAQLRQILQQLATETAGLSERALLLVSDNHSTDDTGVLLRQYALDHPQVAFEAYTQASNIGPIPNIHFLVQTARARWTWCLGDDDLLEKGAVQTVLSALATNDADVLLVRARGTYEWTQIPPGPDLRYVDAATREGAAYLMAGGFLASALLRTHAWRALITRADLFDTPNYANWVAVLLAATDTGRICVLDQVTVIGNATMVGDVRFARYPVLAMQRLRIWRRLMNDAGRRRQAAVALRPYVSSMFWHSWRSIAAGTDQSLPSSSDKWRGFIDGARALGWPALRAVPWLFVSVIVPLRLRLRLSEVLRPRFETGA